MDPRAGARAGHADREGDRGLSLQVAIETSTRAGSVALRAGTRRAEASLVGERAHASDLLVVLEDLRAGLGLPTAERGALEDVVVGTGPGSYTGLRVGIATAFGLVRATGATLRGVPSTEALAFAELEPEEEGGVVWNARAGELYFAHYRRVAGDVETLQPPCVLAPEELRERLPAHGPIFGDDTVAEAAELGESARSRLRVGCRPRAAALLDLGLLRLEQHGPHAFEDVQPLYLRPFAAKARRR